MSGSSDAADIEPRSTPKQTEPDFVEKIRRKTAAGMLPLPAEPPEKCWVGKGTARPCDGCDGVISSDQLEYELDIAGGRTLRFHGPCLEAWHGLRAERLRPTADLS